MWWIKKKEMEMVGVIGVGEIERVERSCDRRRCGIGWRSVESTLVAGGAGERRLEEKSERLEE